MKISQPERSERGEEIVVSYRISSSAGSKTLWYAVGKKYGDFLSESCDAPLLALLIPAMQSGEDIQVAGALSERLWYNLAGPYQQVLRRIIPSLRPVKIHAEAVTEQRSHAAGVATGFSGGVDSYCVLADHYYANKPVGYRLTHLLFNNVGSHGEGGERLFRERFAAMQPVAERTGLPLISVNSNLADFYLKTFDFQQTHTPLNASVPLLLQGGMGCYLYASAYGFDEAYVGVADTMAHSDTIALPLMGTETLAMFSVGSEYTRVEKTLRVAEVSDSYNSIDVCVGGVSAGNCSKCWKCMRTLLTLEIAGYIERYSNSFNLDTYRAHRSKYIGKVVGSKNPLEREIVQFAKERNYPLPQPSRLRALLFPSRG